MDFRSGRRPNSGEYHCSSAEFCVMMRTRNTHDYNPEFRVMKISDSLELENNPIPIVHSWTKENPRPRYEKSSLVCARSKGAYWFENATNKCPTRQGVVLLPPIPP
jgi:hypothetical protein